MTAEWGLLGLMEHIRQRLLETHPEGITHAQLRELGQTHGHPMPGLLTQLTRYCYLYEEFRGRRIHYLVDPERDEYFERRILPYDRSRKETE